MELVRSRGSLLWPRNMLHYLAALITYMRVDLRLSTYEHFLQLRRLVGMNPVL